LLDRGCVTGGWNYGNSNMFGAELHPYVPTTAIAVLALQDRANDAAAQRGAQFLAAQATWERSSYAISLARIALDVISGSGGSLDASLGEQVSTTCDMGNQFGAAQALYALRNYDNHAAFRL
ncbi:MAG TPA: hypothetical protein VK955_06685, partial [Xanthobacteraceae bacterium]|nr:hypothetical protein [Xanthobacteraceae bacterium]